MSRWRGGVWWLTLCLLLPVLLPLALHTRRHALRLPAAAGAQRGLAGADWPGEPLRLLVLGESTVAGVGVETQEQGLVGQLAVALARRQRRPVAWRACGENGITATQAYERLIAQVADEKADLVLLVFGVNDTTGLSSLRRWQGALRSLAARFSAGGARVAFSAVAPMQHFSALPWLLRSMLGARAAMLDTALRQVAADSAAEYCSLQLRFSAEYLASDGYHPSREGYRVWAEGLAETLIPPPPSIPA
nr:SGNH/GDSL hydrolase family protein [uncultured Pseudomonas sp.]